MKSKICLLTEKVTLLSDYPRYKLGCVITDKKNRVLSIGINKSKTHPIQYKYNKYNNPKKIYLHAEIDAIINLNRVNNSSNSYPSMSSYPFFLYICRLTPTGKIALAFPCDACYHALKELGIRKIFYTDSNTWREDYVD